MEYTNNNNIEIVVRLLKENNISDIVISPGGTNIPFIKKLQDDEFFNCFSVVDERSAAYIAIGVYLQRHKPVVILCTSAQATRNYIPALTEAYYKRVPILALTMEKHSRFKYQEYMQAPDQTSLPKDSVKKSFELPFVSDINDYYHSLRIANEALIELTRNGTGPVQLCVPWLDFPLVDIEPEFRTIKYYKTNEIVNEDLANKKILVVIGEHIPFNEVEVNAINSFCEKTNTIIYTNHLSNFSNEYTVKANHLLLCSEIEELNEIKPEVIISIGGQTGDYPFYLAFSKNVLTGIEHWRVNEDGKVIDTYDKLTRVYQGTIIEFFTSVHSSCQDHS
ncbi:MAG: 2-succinyl-5-enolpyruvyl-6-hydroxy-3-cyclohexene-1-carboxylate synthase, partial [Holdemanella biformis]|nr:2-succinyl-5-enolpyruvyl-6-hydroxy-3-cyclohexene-1-carboxylate synthase [Holdemanella biformis]